jgi:hypothetical protein
LSGYSGRDYYELVGPVTGEETTTKKPDGSTPSPIEGVSACSADEVTIYFTVTGFAVGSLGSATDSAASSKQECAEECTAGKELASCNTAEFTDGKCKLYVATKLYDIGEEDAASGTYLIGGCAPADSGLKENKVGEIIPNNLLAGFADVILTTATLQECIDQCTASTEITCKAGHFYEKGESNNCILIADTRFSRPESFGPETITNLPMFYFSCETDPLARRGRLSVRSSTRSRKSSNHLEQGNLAFHALIRDLRALKI